MRPARLVGNLVAGVVVVIAVVILVVHALGTHHTEKAAVASSSSPVQTDTNASTTEQPSGTVPSRSSSGLASAAQLPDQVRTLLEAYYLIKPDDTTAVRRNRLAPLVPAPFLASLDLEVNDGTTADEARIHDRLTIQAQVMEDQLIAEPADGNDSLMTVTVPVTIVTTKPDGTVVQTFEVASTSKWQYRAGKWTILALT